MGLAERKNKQKIGDDPRNLTWSQDKNRFSFQHLQKFGWDPSKGLGSSNDGNPNHIKVAQKLDTGGIGVARAMKEGKEIGGAGEGLDAVLRRLKATGTGPIIFNDDDDDSETKDEGSGKEASPAVSSEALNAVPIVAPEPRRIMASRNKYIKSKRLASQSPAAMAEILGIPLSALTTSGSSTPVPTLHTAHTNTASALSGEPITADSGTSTPASTETPIDDGRTLDQLTTAPISVYEYFRRKLAQKKAEREGLPVPELSYTPEVYNNVAKDFEGKKIKFAVDDEDEDESAPVAHGIGSTSPSENSAVPGSEPESRESTKEERKAAQKAAKVAEKEAKKAAKAEKKRKSESSESVSKKDKKRKREEEVSDSDAAEDTTTEKAKSLKGKEKAADDVTATLNSKESKSKKEKKEKKRKIDDKSSAADVSKGDKPKDKKSKKSNSASTGAATISGQPLRNLNGATARELMQEHQRRLYESRKMKSRNAAYYVAGALILTLGVTYAAVPAYRAFCSATGFSGVPITDPARFLPERLYPSKESALANRITVHFEATASDELKWKFTPQQKYVKVLPGETALAFYTAENWGTEDVIGIATYNTTPSRMAPYFAKVECFCFEQQKIRAGETVDLPVFFFIDRDIIDDSSLVGVDDVVLSYTFFKARRNKQGHLEPDAPLDVVEKASGFEGYELAKKD
ncbi:hypothetical protein QFC22_002702 [Naganishia vaughanmartiniae]|uniref:Uncharacterized protein n=1 Tax=Naganishia vaughanmartiniae TaxID=1424756 RepID=A0ACC2XB10_9TREE|nr:hypothetical protein QFC22_002702 [Naganishia vaughanmartiniae]